jgi:hypothetical protein
MGNRHGNKKSQIRNNKVAALFQAKRYTGFKGRE